MFYPNTTISIYRDTEDVETVHRGTSATSSLIASDVTASIIKREASYPSDIERKQTPDIVTGRCDIGVDVEAGDEVVDSRDGSRYSVVGVVVVDTFVASTKRLNLRGA